MTAKPDRTQTQSTSPENGYLQTLHVDGAEAARYYRSSLVKTEQQKLLERLLAAGGREFGKVADVACGGGTLTYHLRAMFPMAAFWLVELNPQALEIARAVNGE